jgi:hypothetical protein
MRFADPELPPQVFNGGLAVSTLLIEGCFADLIFLAGL